MPANLTPDFDRAQQRYRMAVSDEDRLAALHEMTATIPKHKGTEKLQADLKRRIADLRKAAARIKPGPKDHYHVPRSGAGQVVLVGPPNVGKSHLVGRLTQASVKVADYPFTTVLPVPGMAWYQDVPIELIDTPPVTAEHIPGSLLGTIRAADIIALVVNGATDPLEQTEMLLTLLEGRGLILRSVPQNELDPSSPSDHSAILVVNQMDRIPNENVDITALQALYTGQLEILCVSAATGFGLEQMLQRFWELLALVRVYTKEPGKPVERIKPFILPTGATMEDLARKIHQSLPEKMTFARLWRKGQLEGLQVHRTERLQDLDVVEIHQ